jgi:hypothetical protein
MWTTSVDAASSKPDSRLTTTPMRGYPHTFVITPAPGRPPDVA